MASLLKQFCTGDCSNLVFSVLYVESYFAVLEYRIMLIVCGEKFCGCKIFLEFAGKLLQLLGQCNSQSSLCFTHVAR